MLNETPRHGCPAGKPGTRVQSSPASWGARVAEAGRTPRAIAADLTVVIPTLGRPLLAGCLGAILEGSRWPAAVIVVNQGPGEDIGRWLEDLRRLGIATRHEPCTGRGRALGLNTGLRLVTTPYVLITDDDCIPEAHWIESAADLLEDQPGMVVTGRVATAGEERVLNTVSDPEPSVTRKPGWHTDRLSGGNCGMAVETLRRVGLFDEDPCLRCSEDGEWAYRALRAGIPIAYVPGMLVTHVGWRRMNERLDQYREYARSHGAFFGKHLRRGDPFIAARACVFLARSLRRWLRGVTAGDAELAANGRSYVTELLPGILAGLSSRVRPPALS